MLGDTNSILGVKSSQLDRKFTTGASVWWMPTTKEFGPRGAYGDWEQAREAGHPVRRLPASARPWSLS